MRKVIGIDLDGTLLNDKKAISDFTKQTLAELIKFNNRVVLATGRNYYGAVDYYNQLKLRTPLITMNGALITFPDGTQVKKVIPKKTVKDLYEKLNHLFITGVFNGSDKVLSINANKELEELFNGGKTPNSVDFDPNTIDDEDILNVVALIKETDIKEFEAYFEGLEISPRFWGSHNGECFYDIHLTHVSKASALEEVLETLKLTKDDLITFGDGPNDIEMIKLAKDGIAMKNAKQELKDVADYVTDFDNDNDGIANYLIQYYL